MFKFEDSSDNKLKEHMIAKHDEREFSCEKCEFTVRGRLQIEAHKRKHKEITCEKCRETVPYNSATSHKTKCLDNIFKGWLPSAKLEPTFTFLGRDFAIFNTFSWHNPYQEK